VSHQHALQLRHGAVAGQIAVLNSRLRLYDQTLAIFAMLCSKDTEHAEQPALAYMHWHSSK